MTGMKRLCKELADLQSSPIKTVRILKGKEEEVFHWNLLLVPDLYPFNKGAFKIEICFPPEYPFKPPKINFKTKIYHPNIDEKGQICLPVISADNWKPATKTYQVLQSLMNLIQNPEPEHPLRADLAEEYARDKKKFEKNADEHTRKYAEKRPAD